MVGPSVGNTFVRNSEKLLRILKDLDNGLQNAGRSEKEGVTERKEQRGRSDEEEGARRSEIMEKIEKGK